MVYGVMKKNQAKACTVHRRGQRVALLTVDLDQPTDKEMCEECMGADEVR